MNCFSVKFSARSQNAMTSISMTTLAIISLSGAVWMFQGDIITFEKIYLTINDKHSDNW